MNTLYSSAVLPLSVVRRQLSRRTVPSKRPQTMLVFPTSMARSMVARLQNQNGGETGIWTREAVLATHSLSRRVPSATRPSLRALETDKPALLHGLWLIILASLTLSRVRAFADVRTAHLPRRRRRYHDPSGSAGPDTLCRVPAMSAR